jgi:hypothetical protein
MLYTLVMLVCLIDTPQPCEFQEEMVEGLATHPGVAFMQAQPFVAAWMRTHPRYVVQRWRLLPGRAT